MIPIQLLKHLSECHRHNIGAGICYYGICYLTSKGGSVSGIMPIVNSDAIQAAISSCADIRLAVDAFGGGVVGTVDVPAGRVGVGPGCPNGRAGAGVVAGLVDSPSNALDRLEVEAG